MGHWEREDDDDENVCQLNNTGSASNNGAEDEEVDLHPSTIEFDFDSFGPESFIYAPSASKQVAVETSTVLEPIKEHNTEAGKEQVAKSELEVSQETSAALVRTPAPVHSDNFIDMSQIDLRVIEPYKRVISHAGYCHHLDPSIPAPKAGEPEPAIIVFSACYLPDRSRHDYNYVMDHLFLYVLSSLHELIADDYILIYLHNTQPTKRFGTTLTRTASGISNNIGTSSNHNSDNQAQNNLPTFTWIKRCYQMIDRRLRKNLKILYLVKPTFWLKTIVIMCKPFISAKFSRKLRLVEDVEDLKKRLPIEQLILPPSAENL